MTPRPIPPDDRRPRLDWEEISWIVFIICATVLAALWMLLHYGWRP